MRFLVNLLITAVVVYVLSKLLEPHVVINSFSAAIIFALVLAFLNAIVKPLLVILTLPITIVTLGLFLLIINIIIIKLADSLVDGIYVDGWLWALIFGFLISVLSSILQKLEKRWTL
jgi:Predicted membrane protein